MKVFADGLPWNGVAFEAQGYFTAGIHDHELFEDLVLLFLFELAQTGTLWCHLQMHLLAKNVTW
jgi:hypothetical protein